MNVRAASIASMLLAFPAAAQASTAALLPVVGGDEVGADARAQAQAIAREALEGEGFTVFGADEVVSALPDRLGSCGPLDRCAFELRALLGADIAVGLVLEGDAGRVRRVTVITTGSRGVAHRAEALVDPEAGLPFAVAEPLRATLVTWRTGYDPTPAPPVPIADDRSAGLRVAPHIANWFLGGFLVLGSAPMLGYGINTAARDGECIQQTAAGCTQRVRFEEGAAMFAALGTATLIAGIVFLVAQPIPVFVAADPSSASLHVRGTF